MARLMKNSGIQWIGNIPENWKLKKIKYTLQIRNENNNPIRSRNILSLTAKQGVIPLEEKEGGGN
ncbi:MAG: restriction endonuclease subunit S, partial [Oscillospiraceae bacterium]